MAKASPIVTSFNGGEVSPLLDGRTDFEKYQSSCRLLENYIPLVQGPVTRRPGFKYVSTTKDSADRSWLIPFVFSTDQAFVLEFGDGYIRFFKDRAVLTAGSVTAWSNATAYAVGDLASRLGVNYYCIAAHTNQQPPNATYWYPMPAGVLEIPTPWAVADLTDSSGCCAIEYEQTGDVLRVIVPGYVLYKVSRLSNVNWTVVAADLSQGPFLDENTTSTTIYSSATTGSVTLTASASLFASTDIGRQILLASKDVDDTKMWEPGKVVVLNDERRVGNRVYKALNGGTTGTILPIHTTGAAFDGEAANAIQWQFLHPGYGWAEITAYTSGTVVTATVVSTLPTQATLVANASTNWELGRYSDTTGQPSKLTWFRERLTLAQETTLCMSVAGDFDNFADRDAAGNVVDDYAVTHQIGGSQANKIQWIAASGKLLVGTTGGEWVVGELTSSDPFGPANVKNEQRGSAGSRPLRPVVVDGAVLHVQRAGQSLREAIWSEDAGFSSRDMNILAGHIGSGGIEQMAYQAEPWNVVWCVRGDGMLLGMTYDREQDVYGWHRHPVGGTGVEVESVCAIPSPNNDRDDLWVIVKRTIDGGTVRYVEHLTDGYDGSSLEDCIYLDSALTYDGASTATITGLDHLEGETVMVMVDGARQPNQTVSGGSITLQSAGSVVQVGLPYSSRVKPMRMEAGAADGTAQGKTKRITSVVIRLHETLGLKFGGSESTLDYIFLRHPVDPMNAPPPVNSGDTEKLPWPAGYETEGTILLGQDGPHPSTIVAIMPQVTTYDR